MYTDNTNVTFSAATIPDLESQINSDLKYIDPWLRANKSQCRQTGLGLELGFRVRVRVGVISSRQTLQSLNDFTMNIHIDSVPINQSNQSKSLMEGPHSRNP